MSPFAPSVPAALLSALLLAPSALPQLRDADGTVSASPLGSAGQPAVQTNVEDELYQMSSQAGVIFAGQVLAVRPQLDLAYGSSSGWVEIEFRVDQAIRGCVGEATYVLREWSGLWSGGRQRYSVGQQLLMLLHTPGASGLSSPGRWPGRRDSPHRRWSLAAPAGSLCHRHRAGGRPALDRS